MNLIVNPFLKKEIANNYDSYYQTDFGNKVDVIEKELVSTIIKDLPRTEMLELGSGTGHWSAFFIAEGFELIGVDNSDAMLDIAMKKDLQAKFINADSQNLPFDDNSFSIVSSITMIEFVENQDKVFEEIFRILKPNAWFLLACLNANSVLAKNSSEDEIFKNANFLTPEKIKQKLEKYGNVSLNYGVYLDNNFNLLDGSEDKGNIEPVFIMALVKKNEL